MKPDISEFSYGFALTSELMRTFGLLRAGAPVFPTQVAEGKAGGGFDVKLPALPVFVQFKLSDCLTTRNALDHAHLDLPYYRFKIRAAKHSQQHQLLLDLEARGNIVYYAAPRFHRPDELNEAFSKSDVVSRSAFASPSRIGPLPDLDEHSVSFGPTSLHAIFRSEPWPLDLADPEEAFHTVVRGRLTETEPRPLSEAFYRDLGDELVELFTTRLPSPQADRARHLRELAIDREASDYARFVAHTLFDCELLIATEQAGATG